MFQQKPVVCTCLCTGISPAPKVLTKELFNKPSKDSASLLVGNEKKMFCFRICEWRHE